jgi:hypothetical protein
MDERVVPQPLDLVLDVQFFSLEFRNLKVVGGGVSERLVDFLFERLVPLLEFRKMRFNRHVGCLLAYLSLIGSSYTLTTENKHNILALTNIPQSRALRACCAQLVGSLRGLVDD